MFLSISCAFTDEPSENKGYNLMSSNYELVEQYFENTGVECWECPHFANWTEPHGERLSECELLKEGMPEECPALDTLIEQARKDAE